MSESYILRHADSCQLMKTQLGTTAELPKCSCGLFAFLRSTDADKKKIEELERDKALLVQKYHVYSKRIEELEATIERISQVPDRCRPCNTWEYNMKAAQKPITIPKCVCVKCQHEQFHRLYYMPICPDCGDKRCDKAANHDNECQRGEGDA